MLVDRFDLLQFFARAFIGLQFPPAWYLFSFTEVFYDFLHCGLGYTQFFRDLCTNPIVFSWHGQFLIACLDLGDLLLCRLKRFRRWNLLAFWLWWRFRFWLWRFCLLPSRFTSAELLWTRFTRSAWARTSMGSTRHWLAWTWCLSVRKAHATAYTVRRPAAVVVLAIAARTSISSLTVIAGSAAGSFAIATRASTALFAIITRAARSGASRPAAPVIAWWWGGRQLRTYRLIWLAYLDVILRVKPMACSARGGFRFGWWWNRSCRRSNFLSRCFACCWWRRFGRHLLFSGLLRAIRASHFFSICRLKPLAAGDASHFRFAHA